jgi:hypothetical protein
MEGAAFKPSILVDMRKKRIRIHKHTLHALGDPDFVVLIINPEAHTLGVKCSMLDDKLAHRVHKSSMKKKDCYELYSKRLMAALHELCPDWDDRESYRMEGKIIADEGMAVFSMKDFSVLEH